MKAIILASGIGKRLRPLTNEKPKSLVKLTSKTILECQIDTLSELEVNQVILTTGPFENQVKSFINKRYPNLTIEYVHNSKYDSTNYIYSLWLTKSNVDDDIILVHGDLIFTVDILKKLIDTPGNGVIVNKEVIPPKKDFKAVIDKDRITKIGIDFFGENAFFCLPLYKFLKKDFLIWMGQIEKEIANGNCNIYAEDAFNTISNQIELKPVYISDELCKEIDTLDDLEMIKKLMK